MKIVKSCICLIYAVLFLSVALSLCQEESGTRVNRKEVEEFDFANGLFSRGMYDMAVKEYKKFTDTYPESEYIERADFMIGESFFMSKDYPDAVKSFNEFKTKHASSDLLEKASLREAQIFFVRGDYSKAQELLERLVVLEDKPDINAPALYYLANVLSKTKKYPEAEIAYKKIIKEYSQTDQAFFSGIALGELFFEKGELNNAKIYFSTARNAPNLPEIRAQALMGLANIAFMEKNYQISADQYEKVLVETRISEMKDRAVLGLILSYFKSDMYEEVLKKYGLYSGEVKTDAVKAQLMYVAANSLFSLNDFEKSSELYKKTYEEFPGTEYGKKSLSNYAWALFKSGKGSDSLAYINDLQKGGKGIPDDLLYLKAKILYASGKKDEAIGIYKAIMGKGKQADYYREAVYDLAWIYDEEKEKDKASEYFRLFVREFPLDKRSPELILKSGQNNLEEAKYTEAENDYKLFLEKYGESPLKEKILYQLGNVYLNLNDFDGLIKTYEVFLKEFPSSEAASQVKFWIGYAYQQKGEWDEAAAIFDKLAADKKDPMYLKAIEAKGYVYFRQEKFQDAADIYYELITGTDADISKEIYRWTVEYYFANGESQKSLEVMRAFSEKFPEVSDDGAMMYMLAENLRINGKMDEAKKNFEGAIKAGVGSPYLERTYLGLGRLYAALNDNVKALEYLEMALDSHDDPMVGAYARYEIGNIKYNSGDLEEAAKAYMMVAILYDDKDISPKALFRAGEVFMQDGKRQEALNMFRELKERYPDNALTLGVNKKIKDLLDAE